MAEEDDATPTPVWRDNLLKDRRQEAVSRAEDALVTLQADQGNPLSDPLEAIENGAWRSPSYTRTQLIADLDGAGASVKSAFENAVGELSDSVTSAGPDQIDVANHPDEAWKTTGGGIASSPGYYDNSMGTGGYY